jgi:hypothetical protein
MTVVIDGTTGIDTVQDGTVAPADLTTGAPSWNSAGNLSFNSGYGSVATAYGCRAWVNFNGTGTVAIRASGNVSSITDGGAGIYTVNLSTPMPDANYVAINNFVRTSTWVSNGTQTNVYSTTSFVINNVENNAFVDSALNVVAVFR